MQRLILATSNQHKLIEMRALLGNILFTLISPLDINLAIDVEEPFDTYAENAAQKARAYSLASGLPALADDSGLEIDCMPNELGVYSARFGNYTMPYPERFTLIESRLQQVPFSARTARYRCVMALVLPDSQTNEDTSNSQHALFAEGTVEGIIAFPPQGTHGFGYDPIFYLPAYQQTMAEISPAEKNRISHRALAAHHMGDILRAMIV